MCINMHIKSTLYTKKGNFTFSFLDFTVRSTSIWILLRNGTLKKMEYVFDAAFRVGSVSHLDALCQFSAPEYCRSICRKRFEDFLLFSNRKTIEFERFCRFCLIDLIHRMAMGQNLIFSDSSLLLGPLCKFSAKSTHFRGHSWGPNRPN